MRNLIIMMMAVIYLCAGCTSNSGSNLLLPVLGHKIPVERTDESGNKVIDSLAHTIPDFRFINQDSSIITEKDVEGKIYLSDFFFTSCPTICPKVKKQMKRVYDANYGKEDFLMISHSIDIKYDTVGRLAWYADKFEVESKTWHFVRGEKAEIYNIATDYLLSAYENKDAPQNAATHERIDHSGHIALVDGKRRIRGLYDGLDPDAVDQLIKDIDLLRTERD